MHKEKKIRVLRIINRFNIGGPQYNAVNEKNFRINMKLFFVGGAPEKTEADSMHILEEYGVKAKILNEMKRTPSFFSDRKVYKELKK